MMPLLSSRQALLLGAAALVTGTLAAPAQARTRIGALVVSSSTYVAPSTAIAVGQKLPNSNGAVAVADATYPAVFNNDAVDANFGITAPITLDVALSLGTAASGEVVSAPLASFDVTAATGISTSFSSKSELALNIDPERTSLTLMGYQAPLNELDVSNTDTPGHIDPTNTDTQTPADRAVIDVGAGGLRVTPVAAFSGNNGRAALRIDNIAGTGEDAYLMVGNAGNGSGTEPVSVVSDTGVQLIASGSTSPETEAVGQLQGTPGSKNGFQYGFSVASIGQAADKSGKDDNFRGLTRVDDQVFVSKGSGGNGVDTVYQVAPGADPSDPGAATVTILPGFPTTLAATQATLPTASQFYPFGLFFANKTTLYVADEGPQSLAGAPNAGLQKFFFYVTWWNVFYTLQKGLALDTPYAVSNYPASLSPATTGLRNIGGNVDGRSVTIFASTATFSSAADPGADPNQVVEIVDRLDAKTLPANESFTTVRAPVSGTVYRGVAYLACGSVKVCAGLLASR